MKFFSRKSLVNWVDKSLCIFHIWPPVHVLCYLLADQNFWSASRIWKCKCVRTSTTAPKSWQPVQVRMWDIFRDVSAAYLRLPWSRSHYSSSLVVSAVWGYGLYSFFLRCRKTQESKSHMRTGITALLSLVESEAVWAVHQRSRTTTAWTHIL